MLAVGSGEFQFGAFAALARAALVACARLDSTEQALALSTYSGAPLRVDAICWPTLPAVSDIGR